MCTTLAGEWKEFSVIYMNSHFLFSVHVSFAVKVKGICIAFINLYTEFLDVYLALQSSLIMISNKHTTLQPTACGLSLIISCSIC